MYHGDIRLGDTIDIKFTTRSFTTGAPTTLAGTPVISAYVGNGTTQITAGITLTVDFDAVTGLHNVRVVATSGNGFATATNVELVITTGTVGGVSVVGEVVGSFSIEARSALMPTTAARTLDVTATGAAGIDWANVENPTTALNLSGTNIDVDQVVASVSGAVGSVTAGVTLAASAVQAIWDALTAALTTVGSIGKLLVDNVNATISSRATQTSVDTIDDFLDTEVAAILAAVDTEVAAILADTNDIQTRLPAALTLDGNIKADTLRVGGTLQTAGDLAALLTAIDDFVDTEVAAILAAVDTEVAAILAAVDTEVAAIKAKTDQLTFTVANQIDANSLSISGDGVAADRLEALMDGIVTAAVNGVATTTSIPADGFTEATNDHFKGRLITFTSGALIGQQTDITAYTGATQTFTVTALTEAPADNDTFVIH